MPLLCRLFKSLEVQHQREKKLLGAIALILLIGACQTVQQTGRSQFIVVSESQERQLGEEAYKETLGKNRLSGRGDWQAQLRRVGQRIAAVAEKPDYKWEFNVIQGKEVNTFALPGGKVAFWEGIMAVAQDDNGIADIMGHEIAHAPAPRHDAERMSQAMGAQAIGQVLSVGVGKVTPVYAMKFCKRTAWVRRSVYSPGVARKNPKPIESVLA